MVIQTYIQDASKRKNEAANDRSLKIPSNPIWCMNKVLAVCIGVATSALVAVAIFVLVNVPEYGIEIDAIKVEDLVAISNVRITNTGRMPLSELTIDMGQGDIQRLDSLEPGKTVWLSPKAQNLVSVTVTTKEGLVATKDFREPISMVEVGPG
ncbi:MAG: hypothetical protein AB1608_02045 [Thermoproteota archaeon]